MTKTLCCRIIKNKLIPTKKWFCAFCIIPRCRLSLEFTLAVGRCGRVTRSLELKNSTASRGRIVRCSRRLKRPQWTNRRLHSSGLLERCAFGFFSSQASKATRVLCINLHCFASCSIKSQQNINSTTMYG